MSLNEAQIIQAKQQIANGEVQIQRQKLDLKRSEQRVELYGDEIAAQKAQHDIAVANLEQEHRGNDLRIKQLKDAIAEGEANMAKVKALLAEGSTPAA